MDDAAQDSGLSRSLISEVDHLGVARDPRRARIVLALSKHAYPTESLRRASALADDLDGELHVVRVLPESKTGSAFSRCNSKDVLRAVGRTVLAQRATRSWICESLGRATAVQRVAILHGRFVMQLTAYVREVEAQLILLQPRDERAASLVTRVVTVTGVSVLLMRGATRRTVRRFGR